MFDTLKNTISNLFSKRDNNKFMKEVCKEFKDNIEYKYLHWFSKLNNF